MLGYDMFSQVFFISLVVCAVNSANILGVFMITSISHQIVYQPIWRELSLRGHKVTVLTPHPLKDPQLTNLTEIDVSSAYNVFKKHKINDVLSASASKFWALPQIYDLVHDVAQHELENPEFQNLMNDPNQTFDVILVGTLVPTWYALSFKYKAPLIGLHPAKLPLPQYDAIGNPTHPVLSPDVFLNSQEDLSLYDRIHNSLYHIWYLLYYHYVVTPKSDGIARKFFGKEIPYVGELEKNISLWLIHVNSVLHTVRPNVPAVIYLETMNRTSSKELPTDLQTILDDAKEGVIYFSLGSNVRSSVDLSEKQLDIITEALSELPYKVLWKWESDYLPNKPKNVVVRKWLPQPDVLAHPNVKAFITQGGLQSIEEAISNEVPMVGMPFMMDQPVNIQKLTKLGICIKLDVASMTKTDLKNAIIEVAENEKYRNRIKEIRNILNDQPMAGVEKAIWWIEYVLRHKGAAHLRSPAIDLPWYQYYLLDVIATIILSLIIFYVSLKMILRRITNILNKFTIKVKKS